MKKNRIRHSGIRRCILVLLMASTFPALGQESHKKMLSKGDYALWGTLDIDRTSATALWASYTVQYGSGQDTLWVTSTIGGRTYDFPNGYASSFSGDSYFYCMQETEGLMVIDLATGWQLAVKEAVSYAPTATGIVVACRDSLGNNRLEIRGRDGRPVATIPGGATFSVSPDGSSFVFAVQGSQNQLGIYSLKKKRSITVATGLAEYAGFKWSPAGNGLAFLRLAPSGIHGPESNAVCYYDLRAGTLATCSPENYSDFPKGMAIATSGINPLAVSNDGKRVFFPVRDGQEEAADLEGSDVQVWNGNDNQLYPELKKIGNWHKVEKTVAWYPEKRRILQLTSKELPVMFLDGQQRHAITHNPYQSKSNGGFADPSDFYITDLKSGARRPLFENHSRDPSQMSASPSGKYILYFKGGHWWLYTIATGMHSDLSARFGIDFTDSRNDFPEVTSCGVVGWTANDASLLLYDDYDIWEIVPCTGAKRITDGRPANTRYRIGGTIGSVAADPERDLMTGKVLDPVAGIPLLATHLDDYSNSIWFWKKNTPLVKMASSSGRIDQVTYGPASARCIFREQDYDRPPVLMATDGGSSSLLMASNPQQADYHWGKSEIIHYAVAGGKALRGALFYPAGYDPKIKYPMVVHIYQQQSELVNRYINPSDHEMAGFNVSNFTTRGYLVLLPDIVFEIGNPGLSAASCVIAATQAVIDKGIVDPKRIGLDGHSFGGYEANFIVTQTDMFAAATSGAGLSDLTSEYLTVDWSFSMPQIWKAETNQLRIGKSLFEDPEAYRRNSPITGAARVSAPVLLWTGEEDRHVHYHQTIAFYMALRRLDKRTIMLIYPRETHALVEEKNQADLAHRIEDWFDYHLKGAPGADWILKGISD
ncbi:S9 family peptidase [Flavobacterium macacae]|uniref:S9 family peptidase n=1 Tax=Flavobacterium macacae TaxID=2488993 RepID=A0A3P3WAY3_9FLAO|nr:prolyl oligopeptidase family serine peptidase [Flavobacterium macacae]RRJ90759.1 S9 family peptidase [Flavobacterium macacae]